MFCPRRQARRPLHQLDGRRGEGGHALAADVGQAELLGGGQRLAQTSSGQREDGEVKWDEHWLVLVNKTDTSSHPVTLRYSFSSFLFVYLYNCDMYIYYPHLLNNKFNFVNITFKVRIKCYITKPSNHNQWWWWLFALLEVWGPGTFIAPSSALRRPESVGYYQNISVSWGSSLLHSWENWLHPTYTLLPILDSRPSLRHSG